MVNLLIKIFVSFFFTRIIIYFNVKIMTFFRDKKNFAEVIFQQFFFCIAGLNLKSVN